ncbi:MAG: hypothetical protein ABIR80_02570, partial [Opitutaceae bacterium]
ARFFVKTRGRKALRLVLPEGVKLWEARVDNEVVNARADGEQTLIPLPARTNPNDPVVVALRLGQAAGKSGTTVKLVALRATAPTVIEEWVVRSDTGRLLIPHGGNAEAIQPSLTETGFEWISQRGSWSAFAVLGLAGLGALLMLSGSGARTLAGLLVCVLAMAASLLTARQALADRRVNLREVTYAATMVPAGETVAVQVENVVAWRAMVVTWGAAAAVVGLGLVLFALVRGRETGTLLARVGGWVLLAAGLLAQRGGAAILFFGASAAILAVVVVPGLLRWRRERLAAEEDGSQETGDGGQGAAAVNE